MKRKIPPRAVLPAMAHIFSSLALSSAVEVTSTEATITHLRRRHLEEEIPTDEGLDTGDYSESSSGSDGGIPLSGEFFLMFFYVLLIVFAVLFLPVIWKCAKNAVIRRKVGLSNGDDEGCCTERTKEDILAGVEDIKQKIAEESRKIRYGAASNSSGKNNDDDTSSSADAAAQNEETKGSSDHLQMPQTKRSDSTKPISGIFYGTYYYKNKARMTPMELTFAPHPRGGYVILGSGQVQSGPTELSEGYLNPNGEAYFVEVGGINPTSVDLDVTKDDLTSRRLAESEVTSLLVLYRGKFDFTQSNIVFKGWRNSSTGISRIYHLLRRPRESKIRHVMSTIGSSIHSVGRRRSSAIEAMDEDKTKDEELGNASGLCGETINQSSQQQNGEFALSSSSEGLT